LNIKFLIEINETHKNRTALNSTMGESLVRSKAQLAVSLSKLKGFENPSLKLEQYTTDSEVAAGVLWNAHMNGDLDGKTVADLGAGTGILSAGALLLGAKKVFLVEKDKNALEVARKNLADVEGDVEFVHAPISDFGEKVDVVIQNPPFGTKQKHADKEFLEKAFSIGKIIYSLHKESTKRFVEAIALDFKADITHHWKFEFPLKQTQKFHNKKIQKIEVGCWRFEVKK